VTRDRELEVPFADRDAAGAALADVFEDHPELTAGAPVVVALPRGGVPVAAPLAHALGAPLDVIVVRKLGVPSQPELAMGAIGENGVRIVNEAVRAAAHVDDAAFAAVEAQERDELERRASLLRRERERIPILGRAVIIVDDGIATGATARAACLVAREQGADRVVLAAPVGSPRAVEQLRDVADDVVCVETPDNFFAIGERYRDFAPTTDDEVVRLLAATRR
jgi:putative phosphoribosyl transferase